MMRIKANNDIKAVILIFAFEEILIGFSLLPEEGISVELILVSTGFFFFLLDERGAGLEIFPSELEVFPKFDIVFCHSSYLPKIYLDP